MSNQNYQIDSPWPHRGGVENDNARDVSRNSVVTSNYEIFFTDPSYGYYATTPVIDASGTVYVFTLQNVYAINQNKSIKWKIPCNDSTFYSTPAIAPDGTVYCVINNGLIAIPPDYPATPEINITSLLGLSILYLGFFNSITLNHNVLYVAGGIIRQSLYVFDLSDNPQHASLLWKSENPTALSLDSINYSSSTAVGKDGTVFTGIYGQLAGGTYHRYLLAYDPVPLADQSMNVQPKWISEPLGTTLFDSNVFSPVIDASGTIYILGFHNELYAFDPSAYLFNDPSAVPYKWVAHESECKTYYNSPALGSDGTVFVTSKYGVYAFDPSNGSLLSHYPMDTSCTVVPCIGRDSNTGNDVLYVTENPLNVTGLEWIDASFQRVFTQTVGSGAILNFTYDQGFSLDAFGSLYVPSFVQSDFNMYRFTDQQLTAPTITSAVPGFHSVTIAFIPPTSDGGSPITDYFYFLDGSQNSLGQNPPNPFTITGLTNGQNYQITMRAMNANGPGLLSNSVEVIPGTPPSPTITNVIIKDTEVSIYFTQPASVVRIDGYNVSLNSGQDFLSNLFPPINPIVLTGLTKYTSYHLVIAGVNLIFGGKGLDSNVFPITTTCFKKGTKILTDQGYRPIEALRKGDRVKTLWNGYVPIHSIGKQEIYHPALVDTKEPIGNQLYVCSKERYPEITEDLVMTGYHAILIYDFEDENQKKETFDFYGDVYITDDRYRYPVCLDKRAKVYEEEGMHTIYHLALENTSVYKNHAIYANGLLVESCSINKLNKRSGMEMI